jgi:hypothetical protein
MPNYTTTVTATTNAVAGTEDNFIELPAAASSEARLKRVSVSMQTPASDARLTVTPRRTSTAGAGSVAGVAVRRAPAMRGSSVAPVIKSGATAFAIGTVVDVLPSYNVNGRATYEWIPRNYMEEAVIPALQRIAIGVACNVASQVVTVTAEYED